MAETSHRVVYSVNSTQVNTHNFFIENYIYVWNKGKKIWQSAPVDITENLS